MSDSKSHPATPPPLPRARARPRRRILRVGSRAILGPCAATCPAVCEWECASGSVRRNCNCDCNCAQEEEAAHVHIRELLHVSHTSSIQTHTHTHSHTSFISTRLLASMQIDSLDILIPCVCMSSEAQRLIISSRDRHPGGPRRSVLPLLLDGPTRRTDGRGVVGIGSYGMGMELYTGTAPFPTGRRRSGAGTFAGCPPPDRCARGGGAQPELLGLTNMRSSLYTRYHTCDHVSTTDNPTAAAGCTSQRTDCALRYIHTLRWGRGWLADCSPLAAHAISSHWVAPDGCVRDCCCCCCCPPKPCPR